MDSPSVALPDARDAKSRRHAELQALLARVEAATGPDRELDAHLWAATEGRSINIERGIVFADAPDGDRMPMGFIDPGKHNSNFTIRSNFKCPDYSASLDAALALVERTAMPEPDFDICFRQMGRRGVRWYMPERSVWLESRGANVPLGLLAALLKALLSSEEQPSACEQREQCTPATATPLLNTSAADEKR